MKLSEFNTLTYKELDAMDISQLRKLATEQGKKLNKRLSHLRGNKEASHIAYNEVMKSGGKFGSGKVKKGAEGEKKALINEIKREQRFSTAKSGTVLGAIKQKQEIQKSTGQTSKEYGKRKGKEYEKEETEKLKKKSKTGKLTKAQKKRISKERKRIEREAKKKYDKAVGEAWDVFHRWKEEHPTLQYTKENVKASVNEYAIKKSDIQPERDPLMMELKSKFDMSVNGQPEPPDVWTTVNDGVTLPFI